MYYIKFDCNGNATIYEFEKKMHTVCGTFVPVNRLVSSETGRASELLPKRGIFPVSDETETVNFASVEYNFADCHHCNRRLLRQNLSIQSGIFQRFKAMGCKRIVASD